MSFAADQSRPVQGDGTPRTRRPTGTCFQMGTDTAQRTTKSKRVIRAISTVAIGSYSARYTWPRHG